MLATTGPLAEPVEQAIHLSGEWTIYFLLATLTLTPLKRLVGWPKLAVVRRMLGITVFCYAFAHLVFYAVDQALDLGLVVSEIVNRFYLTIGFVALLGFGAQAATSFDGAIRRMGRNWKRLHLAVYPLAVLGLLHFFLQSKSDVTQPVLMTGLFAGLMLHRVRPLMRLPGGIATSIVVVAVVAGLATAGIEYLWYATQTGLPANRILAANLDLGPQLRPAWWVAIILLSPLAWRGLARLWQAVKSVAGAQPHRSIARFFMF